MIRKFEYTSFFEVPTFNIFLYILQREKKSIYLHVHILYLTFFSLNSVSWSFSILTNTNLYSSTKSKIVHHRHLNLFNQPFFIYLLLLP